MVRVVNTYHLTNNDWSIPSCEINDGCTSVDGGGVESRQEQQNEDEED